MYNAIPKDMNNPTNNQTASEELSSFLDCS